MRTPVYPTPSSETRSFWLVRRWASRRASQCILPRSRRRLSRAAPGGPPSILQVHGSTLPAKPPQPTLGPQPAALTFSSRCQRSSRRSFRASRANEIAKHIAKLVRGREHRVVPLAVKDIELRARDAGRDKFARGAGDELVFSAVGDERRNSDRFRAAARCPCPDPDRRS